MNVKLIIYVELRCINIEKYSLNIQIPSKEIRPMLLHHDFVY